jgi:hypothetical protein
MTIDYPPIWYWRFCLCPIHVTGETSWRYGCLRIFGFRILVWNLQS